MQIADEIRLEIKATQESELEMKVARTNFTKTIDHYRVLFRERGDDVNLIPELKTIYENEIRYRM